MIATNHSKRLGSFFMKEDKNTSQNPEETISDERAYERYLLGEESAAEILVERYGDALIFYINGISRIFTMRRI